MKKLFTLLFVFMAALSASAEDYEVEAANIAAFNAIEDGKVVKLTLTNARVNAYDDITPAYYVEDATGATTIKGTSLTVGTLLNGYIVGKKDSKDVDSMHDPSWCIEPSLTVENASLSSFEATATTLVGAPMTITEACTQANHGKLVTLSDITITPIGNGMNKQLEDANGNKMRTRDLFGVLPDGYTWPEHASKMTGLFIYYYTAWFLIPISADAIVPYVQPTEVTFDFTSEGFRGYVGTSAADKKGWILNETKTKDNVSIQLTAGSSCTRINKTTTKPACLTMDKEYSSMTLKAPEGYSITKVEFTTESGNVNFTPSTGTLTEKVWTGNAEGVRFNTTSIHYLKTVAITLTEKNNETTALLAINYAECANIAAFNALEKGTYAKVTLKDAEVIGKSGDNYSTTWVQDATGGCWIQYSSIFDRLQEKTKLNGSFFVVKRLANNNNQMKETEDTPNSVFTAEEITDYTMIEGTIADVNIPANMNRVVKISGASFVATSATAGTLTQGETSITVSKGSNTAPMQLDKIAETWTKDVTKLENVTIVAIILNKNSGTEQQLLPITMTGTASGISNINAADVKDVQIYNLQGVRMNSLKKGLNIVNGKKVVVK